MLALCRGRMLPNVFPRGLVAIVSDNNTVYSIILGAIRPGLI